MVVSITVLAILSASAAVFMRGPITSYFDTERRANLSDVAGLAMAKLSQDIARAVPNSVRVSTVAGRVYIEFLPTTGEGRFRVGGPGNVLTFGSPDTGFDALLCVTPTGACTAGSWVVINNHLAGQSRRRPSMRSLRASEKCRCNASSAAGTVPLRRASSRSASLVPPPQPMPTTCAPPEPTRIAASR